MIQAREPETLHGAAAAKKAVGGKAKDLAKLLGISGAAVSRWGDTIPMGRVLDVEKATGVPRYVLRPDLFAAPINGKPRRAA